LANRADAVATVAIVAVVVTTPALGKYVSIIPMSSHKVTQILGPSGLFLFICNSYPDTFSVWAVLTSPILLALGGGQSGSSCVSPPVEGGSGVAGVLVSGSIGTPSSISSCS